MNGKRALLFKLGAAVIVLAVAVLMFIIGRGHTVYFDNKPLEYEGKTYASPYKITVLVKGEQAAKLYEKERGMTTWIGQNFKMTLEVIDKKGGQEAVTEYSLKLPRKLDGIVINLPAYMAGLPEEAYLSEFVSLIPEAAPEDEEIVIDEFALATESAPVE